MKWLPAGPDPKEDPALFLNVHDDEDQETLDLEEVERAICAYQDAPVQEPEELEDALEEEEEEAAEEAEESESEQTGAEQSESEQTGAEESESEQTGAEESESEQFGVDADEGPSSQVLDDDIEST
eukprot:6340492-Prymnesium_polylepis.1